MDFQEDLHYFASLGCAVPDSNAPPWHNVNKVRASETWIRQFQWPLSHQRLLYINLIHGHRALQHPVHVGPSKLRLIRCAEPRLQVIVKVQLMCSKRVCIHCTVVARRRTSGAIGIMKYLACMKCCLPYFRRFILVSAAVEDGIRGSFISSNEMMWK